MRIMANSWCRVGRKVIPWLGAGVLLQAGGCDFSGGTILQTVLSVVLNNFFTDLAIGIFNTPI